MNPNIEINESIDEYSIEDLANRPHSQMMNLNQVLPHLASPDSGKKLTYSEETKILSDGINSYPAQGNTQNVLPARLHEYFSTQLEIPIAHYQNDSFLQYFLISAIKQHGDINAPSDSIHYRHHLWRIASLLKSAKGTVLDVGCDDLEIGTSILPVGVEYVGLDPFCENSKSFRLIGVAEYLPLRDKSVDGVLLNTSLGHVLDWRTALAEAMRVLGTFSLVRWFGLSVRH